MIDVNAPIDELHAASIRARRDIRRRFTEAKARLDAQFPFADIDEKLRNPPEELR